MSSRILLATLVHETHTFLDGTTPLADWTIRRGEALWEARDDGSPLSGVLAVAEEAAWDLVPTIELRAMPSAIVDDEVLETFWDAVQAGADTDGLDGIYLVLHGAMACVSFPDVEGEVIRRLRETPGLTELPICGVLDLHGNISRETIERTQGLIAYRHNPHTDARQAAVDGARLLEQIMSTGQSPTCVWERPPVMWPPTGTGTGDEPMRTLEAMARRIEQEEPDIVAVNVMGGFSFADTPDTGVSFAAVTFGDPEQARRRLGELSMHCLGHRELGNVVDPPLADVIEQVAAHVADGETPVVLVEPADNIGGGAPGDATTILAELVSRNFEHSVAIINDPVCIAALEEIAIGDSIRLSIGGKSSRLTDGPLELDVQLQSRSDGKFTLEDHHSHMAAGVGIHVDMGPSAVVRHGNVTILLTTLKTPPFDLGQLRSQGIEPETCSVVNIKAAVAHRRTWDPITAHSYTVDTPGPCSSDVTRLPFQNVVRPVFPLDESVDELT